MSKKVTSQENACTVVGPLMGGIVATAVTPIATDVTSLCNSYQTLQAFVGDLDFYMADQALAPTLAPIITATPLNTAAVGRRVIVGVDKDFWIPQNQSGKMWLVHQAAAVGLLRILPS